MSKKDPNQKVIRPFPSKNIECLGDWINPIRVLIGPLGFSKTFTVLWDAFIKAKSIAPGEDGVKRSTIGFARKRYDSVDSSVLKVLRKKIFNGASFKRKRSKSQTHYPIRYTLKFFDKESGCHVESEWSFWAFAHDESVEKLTSEVFSAFYVVEPQEMTSKKIIEKIITRIRDSGQDEDVEDMFLAPIEWEPIIPPAVDLDTLDQERIVCRNNNYFYKCWVRPFLCDANYTLESSWFKEWIEDTNVQDPDTGLWTRKIYRQPQALLFIPNAGPEVEGVSVTYRKRRGKFVPNPEAEEYATRYGWVYHFDNVRALINSPAELDIALGIGFGKDTGENAVFYDYNPDYNTQDHWEIKHDRPIFMGVDNGRKNAWSFGQQGDDNRIYVFDEISNHDSEGKEGDDHRARPIAAAMREQVIPYLNRKGISRSDVIMVYDWALNQGDQYSDFTALNELSKFFANAEPAPHQDAYTMLKQMNEGLRLQDIVYCQNTKILREASNGKYQLRLENGRQKPVKNKWSHISDATAQMYSHMVGEVGTSNGNKLNDNIRPVNQLGV